MKNSMLFFNIISLLLTACNTPQKEIQIVKASKNNILTTEASFPLKHTAFSKLLEKHTLAGKVNYKSLNKEKDLLESYLELLAANPPEEKWSQEEQLAYWINLYNASTINIILEHYPITSIKDINNGNAWSLKIVQVADTLYSLDEIENNIIRPIFKDPRIHFALNCGANSCAPMQQKAYEAQSLNNVLTQQTKQFINQETKLSGNNELEVSKLFEWYNEDFSKTGDSVINFLNQYLDSSVDNNVTIKYSDYDWKLNQ